MTKISVEKAFRRKYIFPNAFHFSPQYDFDPNISQLRAIIDKNHICSKVCAYCFSVPFWNNYNTYITICQDSVKYSMFRNQPGTINTAKASACMTLLIPIIMHGHRTLNHIVGIDGKAVAIREGSAYICIRSRSNPAFRRCIRVVATNTPPNPNRTNMKS